MSTTIKPNDHDATRIHITLVCGAQEYWKSSEKKNWINLANQLPLYTAPRLAGWLAGWLMYSLACPCSRIIFEQEFNDNLDEIIIIIIRIIISCITGNGGDDDEANYFLLACKLIFSYPGIMKLLLAIALIMAARVLKESQPSELLVDIIIIL